MHKLFALAGAAVAGLTLITPSIATAQPKASALPVVKSSQLGAPFNLLLTGGKVYVADGGLNLVGKLKSNGSIATIAADQPGASGIAMSKDHRTLAFTTTVTDPETFENSASGLHLWSARGKRLYADTHAFEVAHNPDQVNTYGPNSTDSCVTAVTGPAAPGAADSHAYSVAAYKNRWVVADAGGNDLLTVSKSGTIHTLAVLPPQRVKITAAMAKAAGLPDCLVGVTVRFEPVPTDVEVGRNGMLYVTTLPGGPEDGSLGNLGKLWRIDPHTGKARVIARGLAGPTNLALGRNGKIYVAEFYAGKISVVRHGRVRSYVTLPGVVAVETTGNRKQLWAGTLGSADGPGTIVKVVKGKAAAMGVVAP